MSDKDTIADQPKHAILGEPVWMETILGHLPPQPSENWERAALAALLWLIVNKRAPSPPWRTFNSVGELAAWYPRQTFCGSEELLAKIYGARNISDTIAAREALKVLGHAEGYAFLTDWCRAAAGYMVLGTGQSRGKDVDESKVHASINTPQFIVHTSAPNNRVAGAPFLTTASDRSWVSSHPGFLGNTPMTAMTWLLYGDVKRYLSAELATQTLRALHAKGHDINLLTPAEVEVAKRAIQNDVSALLTIWNEWLPRVPLPGDEYIAIRRTTGEESACLAGPKAPTARIDYQSHRTVDNEVRSMMANDGYRTGQDTDGDSSFVEPTAVEYDAGFTTWTAYVTDEPRQRISCSALEGEIVFAARFGDGSRTLLVPKVEAPPATPPATPPSTPETPRKKGSGGCQLMLLWAALLGAGLAVAVAGTLP